MVDRLLPSNSRLVASPEATDKDAAMCAPADTKAQLGIKVAVCSLLLALACTHGTPLNDARARPCGTAGSVTVRADANIFGAGLDDLPAPGGGGAGTAPVCIGLPDGTRAFVVTEASGSGSFHRSASAGQVFHKCGSGRDFPLPASSGPDGEEAICWGGVIDAAGVISGIASTERVGYIVGVFLADPPPVSPPPRNVDVDGHYDDVETAPELARLFFVGDGHTSGGTLQRFLVPVGADRLYLGIADAFLFEGRPGYYGIATGGFVLTVGLRQAA